MCDGFGGFAPTPLVKGIGYVVVAIDVTRSNWLRRFGAARGASEAVLTRTIDTALPRIFGYILVRVDGNRAVAEDLTQETMIALAKALARPDMTIADPIAWLFGIARHKVVDHYRSRGALLADPAELESVVDPVQDMDKVLDRDELTAYLSQIPPQQRLALLLHYGDGLGLEEIGGLIGKSPHAIESLLARGRKSMRRIAAEEDHKR
jgi:RNA polymerase sigma-70 factor, ECF subfamily